MTNPFESGARKAIPAVLVYARRGDQVLMLHRNRHEPQGPPKANRCGEPSKEGDYHLDKWNGLGGKLELDESPLEAARRELREESGLELSEEAFRSLGTVTFPNFKAHKNEDWIVFVYSARVPEGMEPVARGPEGDLHWVAASELEKLNLWAGDRHFIGHVASERAFGGTIWYQGERVLRHRIAPL